MVFRLQNRRSNKRQVARSYTLNILSTASRQHAPLPHNRKRCRPISKACYSVAANRTYGGTSRYFCKSTGLYTEVTAGVDALNGPEPRSAAGISAAIQYNSSSSTQIASFANTAFLALPSDQRSTILFSREGIWSWAFQWCGRRDASIRTKTVRHMGSEIRVHARTQRMGADWSLRDWG